MSLAGAATNETSVLCCSHISLKYTAWPEAPAYRGTLMEQDTPRAHRSPPRTPDYALPLYPHSFITLLQNEWWFCFHFFPLDEIRLGILSCSLYLFFYF